MNGYTWAGLLAAVWTTTVTTGADLVTTRLAGPIIEGHGFYADAVVPGEPIMVPWSIAKRTDCPGSASRVWSGDGGFYMVEASRPTAIPMSDAFVEYLIPTEIPALVRPGRLSMSIVGTYDCGGVEKDFKLGPVDFTVLPEIDGD